jgi:hypothetical protein
MGGKTMKPTRWDELFSAWSEGRLSSEDAKELNDRLRRSREDRDRFRAESKLHGLLHAAANEMAVEEASNQSTRLIHPPVRLASAMWVWRQAIGVVLGVLAGVLSVTVVWAYSAKSLVATSQSLAALRNGSFESGEETVPRGFPTDVGFWSGDDLVAVNRVAQDLPDGHRMMQFIAAMPDASEPNAPAIACDLFQLVDLRDLQSLRREQQDVMLELSATFRDERPTNTKPSVTFFCQLYLFRGDPSDMHQRWPKVISEAISSGSAQTTTLGNSGWKEITARCLVPVEAKFAVVHLAARPNLRVPMPDGLFVDHARLVAKVQPVLPVRMVQSL